jgi:hypothetical protein
MRWTVTAGVGEGDRPRLEAISDDPKPRGVRWVWHGGRLVDYGLHPGPTVDCLSVPYEWVHGVVELAYTPEAFASWLDQHYADPENVTQARLAIAKG